MNLIASLPPAPLPLSRKIWMTESIIARSKDPCGLAMCSLAKPSHAAKAHLPWYAVCWQPIGGKETQPNGSWKADSHWWSTRHNARSHDQTTSPTALPYTNSPVARGRFCQNECILPQEWPSLASLATGVELRVPALRLHKNADVSPLFPWHDAVSTINKRALVSLALPISASALNRWEHISFSSLLPPLLPPPLSLFL